MRLLESRRTGAARLRRASVRVKWNGLLVGRVLGHRTVNGLLRELRSNPTLRRVMGIPPAQGPEGAPDKHEMSRFWKKLAAHHREDVERVMAAAIEELRKRLPALGEQLGTDTTALRAWARGRRDPSFDPEALDGSENADPEADWGKKTRRWKDKQGGAQRAKRKAQTAEHLRFALCA